MSTSYRTDWVSRWKELTGGIPSPQLQIRHKTYNNNFSSTIHKDARSKESQKFKQVRGVRREKVIDTTGLDISELRLCDMASNE